MGKALIYVRFILVIAGLSLEGVSQLTFRQGLESGAIGPIWIVCEYLSPTTPRR